MCLEGDVDTFGAGANLNPSASAASSADANTFGHLSAYQIPLAFKPCLHILGAELTVEARI